VAAPKHHADPVAPGVPFRPRDSGPATVGRFDAFLGAESWPHALNLNLSWSPQLGVAGGALVVRWWSKERRPASCGETQVQGLPGARYTGLVRTPDGPYMLPGMRAWTAAISLFRRAMRSRVWHRDGQRGPPFSPETAGRSPSPAEVPRARGSWLRTARHTASARAGDLTGHVRAASENVGERGLFGGADGQAPAGFDGRPVGGVRTAVADRRGLSGGRVLIGCAADTGGGHGDQRAGIPEAVRIFLAFGRSAGGSPGVPGLGERDECGRGRGPG
jgi:hypothetical protein